MTEKAKELTEEQELLIENYLKSYRFCHRLLAMKNYEDKYFDTMIWESDSPVEFTVAKAKMYEVRHFILGLKNNKGKLILYYYYVRGNTVEHAAELLGISRSTAFRLKKKALSDAYYYALSIGKDLEKVTF